MDVLNLEFPNLDRDRHIITPVYAYLGKKYGLKIVSRNLNNRFFFLLKYRPSLLLLSNAHGQPETIEIMKVARKAGIAIVTLVTEGNFHEENLHGYLWGWNNEKVLYQDAFILWNERSRKIALKHHPELAGKLFVSGATGFDRYRLFKFRDKTEFLSQYGLKKFRGIIGIAGFGVFDHVENRDYIKKMQPAITDEQIDMHINDLHRLRDIYYEMISDHPDLLFILRVHPQVRDIGRSEFTRLLSLPNVIVSDNYKKSDFALNSISDVISVCDLWLGYESTTVIEAWLLGKPTILINPSGADFIRENHSDGCPKVKTLDEINTVIDEFYRTGKIESNEALKERRGEIINDIIGYDDGYNHRRAAELVFEQLKNRKRPNYLNIFFSLPFRFALITTLRYYLFRTWIYKKIRPGVWASHHWYPLDKAEVQKFEQMYSPVV